MAHFRAGELWGFMRSLSCDLGSVPELWFKGELKVKLNVNVLRLLRRSTSGLHKKANRS